MIGSTISHYRILELIGKGGMGEVYLAEDLELGRRIALKILPPELVTQPDRLERFRREAKTLAALNHPNIVTIHSVETAVPAATDLTRPDPVPAGEGEPLSPQAPKPPSPVVHFLTMELVDGKTVADSIPPGGLAAERILELSVPLADALAKAHATGVVHRDLKPGNVMVTSDGRVKVLDFGLAKLRSDPSVDEGTQIATEGITGEGRILGTVPYMSPEQIQGKEVDQRSDVFSLGVILFEMATGKRPFQGESSPDLISSILRDTPKRVDRLRGGLPHHLARVIGRCLEKDPERRYQSAIDVRNELSDLSRELETKAVLEEHAEPATAPERPSIRGWLVGIAAVVAMILVASVVAFKMVKTRRPVSIASQTAAIRSLAVLPFDNLMNDPEQDYFVDGMHEALITDLAKISDLKVISRTSAMRYKGSDKALPEIARELGVEALVEGSVLRAEGQVRITAQLIDGASDEHLWAESYDRDLENLLALLSDVARAIATEIEVELTQEQERLLTSRTAVNPEVQEVYLKGRSLLNRFEMKHVPEARRLFEQVLAMDPDFAPAISGLASCDFLLGFFGRSPLEEAMPAAEKGFRRALEIDPDLSQARSLLGWVKMFYHWDIAGGVEEFERALRIDPNDPIARHGMADYYMILGDRERSVEEVMAARRVDPLSRVTVSPVIGHLTMARRYDEALDEIRQWMALFPDDKGVIGIWLPMILKLQGRYEEALEEERSLYPPESAYLKAVVQGYEEGGPRGADRAAAEFLASQPSPSLLLVARYYAAAGEIEMAFDWLDRAYQEREPQILHVVAYPQFDALRSDPRYEDLLRRIGIPQEARP
ncbi:MAG: protein kinase [Thermoanaerobaculia bacterium]